MKIPFFSRFESQDTLSVGPQITYAGSLSAENKTYFSTILLNILRDLPDLLSVSIVEINSGRLLAIHQMTGKLTPAKAATFNAEVIKQKQRALHALNLTQEEVIEDILVTLQTQWHILRLLPNNRHFVYLMIGMSDTNLAIARNVMQIHATSAAHT